MKITKEKFTKLLKARIISARETEDWNRSKGNIEKAEYWKKTRWTLEDVLEMFTDSNIFEREYSFYSKIVENIEEL